MSAWLPLAEERARRAVGHRERARVHVDRRVEEVDASANWCVRAHAPCARLVGRRDHAPARTRAPGRLLPELASPRRGRRALPQASHCVSSGSFAQIGELLSVVQVAGELAQPPQLDGDIAGHLARAERARDPRGQHAGRRRTGCRAAADPGRRPWSESTADGAGPREAELARGPRAAKWRARPRAAEDGG